MILRVTLKIGNSALEIIDAASIYQPMPGMYYLYVDDAGAVYSHAVRGGGEAISAADPPYGDRHNKGRCPQYLVHRRLVFGFSVASAFLCALKTCPPPKMVSAPHLRSPSFSFLGFLCVSVSPW